MRRIIVFLLASVFLLTYADPDEIVLNNPNNQHDHSGQPLFPADQPAVYYDDVAQQIIVDGTGEADYYDLEVNSLSDGDQLIGTRVSGSYATIDVSSLPADDYQIVISSIYNVYEGYFSNY